MTWTDGEDGLMGEVIICHFEEYGEMLVLTIVTMVIQTIGVDQ